MSWYRVMCCGNLAICSPHSNADLRADLADCLTPECAAAWPVGHRMAVAYNATDRSERAAKFIADHYAELASAWFDVLRNPRAGARGWAVRPNHIRALPADLQQMIHNNIAAYIPHVVTTGSYECNYFEDFLPPGAPEIFVIRCGKLYRMYFREGDYQGGRYAVTMEATGLTSHMAGSSTHYICKQCIGTTFCPGHKYLEVGVHWVRRIARLYGLEME